MTAAIITPEKRSSAKRGIAEPLMSTIRRTPTSGMTARSLLSWQALIGGP